MSYYLAPSLARLRDEINARWPGRSKRSDGWIGDAAHSSRTSDHNPNRRRSVNAIDVTAKGIDPTALIRTATKDPRVNYVIFNRRIWSRVRGFRPIRYTGSNPHTAHVHISIRQARSAEQDTRAWGLGSAPAPKPQPKPAPPKAGTVPGPGNPFPLPAGYYFGPKNGGDRSVSGHHGRRFAGIKDSSHLIRFTEQLARRGWSIGRGRTWLSRSGNDGLYGDEYAALIRAFQKDQGLPVDGLLGRQTWEAAYRNPVR